MVNGFLLGVIVTASLTAGAFFWRFWRQTRDALFFAFGAAFMIEGLNRASFLFLDAPNEGGPLVYTVRLLAYVLLLLAIVNKNRS